MAPFLDNNLNTFRKLQILIAAICFFIPLIFKSCDKDVYYPVMVQSAGLSKIISCNSLIKIEINSAVMSNRKKDTVLKLKICRADLLVDSIIKIKKGHYGFRASLSEYAYGSKSYVFGLFYCMAAMLFIFNGAVYLNNTQQQKFKLSSARYLLIDNNGSWYNISIGISLLGVVFCPQYDLPVFHVIFTAFFFIGNFIVFAFFPNPREMRLSKTARIIIAVLVVIALACALFYKRITVLQAEWISLSFISLHLIGAAKSAKKVQRYSG